MPKQIKIKEINPDVIPIIRAINTKNSNYKILKHSIEQDGQHNPILIRPLTDSEKQNIESHVNYGIIDGHHRYAIAKENHQQTILAEIDTEPPSAYRDMVLALRLNVSNIRMKPVEKGEVIYKILEAKIGKDLFGLKTSMTYNCLNLYKKANNIPTIERPRRNAPNIDMNNPDTLGAIEQTFSYMIAEHPNISSSEDCERQLEKLNFVKIGLNDYKKALLKLKEELENE